MRQLLVRLWSDDAGAIIATEWVFIVTIMVIGLVVGLKTVQAAVLNELEEVAGAIGALSQTYTYAGVSSPYGSSNGSSFTDTTNTYPVNVNTEGIDAEGVSCPD